MTALVNLSSEETLRLFPGNARKDSEEVDGIQKRLLVGAPFSSPKQTTEVSTSGRIFQRIAARHRRNVWHEICETRLW